MNKEDKHKPKEHNHGAHKAHRKVFDVVPPGRAPASATSRPVIMGHKPPVPDDQFVASNKTPLPDVTDWNVSAGDNQSAPTDSSAPTTTSIRASNPADRRTLLNPKHKVEIAPSHADLEVGAVATATDVQQPTERDADPQASASSDLDKLAASASALSPSQASRPSEGEVPTPAFPMTDQASTAAPSASSPSEPSADASTAKKAPSVWEMPDKTDNSSQNDSKETNSASVAVASGNSNAATSTVLQSLTAEESKNTPSVPSQQHSSKTIDELLAETGAPNLETTNEPPQKTIISHHQPHQGHSARNVALALLIVIILAVVVADLLLDGGFITTKLNIPHTHFF